ncbi:TIGR00730 family Rossman fold protein [Thalassobacillus devorans]|uniref:LOG family protein n=1 Tax=Thalassobacillus devorans TaxID=279813 RepID=UPI000490629D|nr:TIGR00730 family Rossman fold protein [Thalassobacillus devorans]
MDKIAVFCGASMGASVVYAEGAKALGKELARQNITLVYGGASVGMMGTIADAVLEENGQAIGVMPGFLDEKEHTHQHLSELIVVDSMHERKAKMAELADGFIVMPGGAGTMEEFFEIFTWAQLGLHRKPFGLYNVNQYYQPLVALFNHMAKERFLAEEHRTMALVDDNAEGLVKQLQLYNVPRETKTYISEEQT